MAFDPRLFQKRRNEKSVPVAAVFSAPLLGLLMKGCRYGQEESQSTIEPRRRVEEKPEPRVPLSLVNLGNGERTLQT